MRTLQPLDTPGDCCTTCGFGPSGVPKEWGAEMRRTADRHPAARTRSNRALTVFLAVFFLVGLGAIAPMGTGLVASAGASENEKDQTTIGDERIRDEAGGRFRLRGRIRRRRRRFERRG